MLSPHGTSSVTTLSGSRTTAFRMSGLWPRVTVAASGRFDAVVVDGAGLQFGVAQRDQIAADIDQRAGDTDDEIAVGLGPGLPRLSKPLLR
ncbi:MAG: hypothetical protein MZW92_75455 [Comamonadaceae bacterium]|nr:hypothetical protein [Comamonadaceae bacterium]